MSLFKGSSGLFAHNIHPKFEILHNSETKEYRWHIVYYGKIVAASSEGYENKQDAIDNVKAIGKHIVYLEANDLIK